MLMVMSMKENGKMIRPMGMENICIQMALNTRVNGKKISNMVRVKKPGQMVLAMKVIMLKERKMALVNLNGLMAPHTKDNFLITTFMEEVSISGLTIDATMVSG